jgi:hypothetical protein
MTWVLVAYEFPLVAVGEGKSTWAFEPILRRQGPGDAGEVENTRDNRTAYALREEEHG